MVEKQESESWASLLWELAGWYLMAIVVTIGIYCGASIGASLFGPLLVTDVHTHASPSMAPPQEREI